MCFVFVEWGGGKNAKNMLWTEVIMRKDLQLKWAIRSNRFELYMANYLSLL